MAMYPIVVGIFQPELTNPNAVLLAWLKTYKLVLDFIVDIFINCAILLVTICR